MSFIKLNVYSINSNCIYWWIQYNIIREGQSKNKKNNNFQKEECKLQSRRQLRCKD